MLARGIGVSVICSCLVALAEDTPLSIIHENCISCHSPAKRKGGLLLDSRDGILQGGESGAAVELGDSGGSYLIETLFPDAESHMPPKGQLSPREIAALEKWIDSDLPWDEEEWLRLTKPVKKAVEFTGLPRDFRPVLAMALSPGGNNLAVGLGGRVEWFRVERSGDADAKKGPNLHHQGTLLVHRDLVRSVAFSPDGKQLVTGDFRRLVWTDLSTRESLEMDEPFLGRLTALAFSPDGKTLAVADSLPSQVSMLHIIDVETRKIRSSIEKAHDDAIYDLVFSRDGSQLASASADKLVLIRDTTEFAIQTKLEGHTSYVLGVAFGPEDKRIATSGDDGVIKVWNTGSGKQILSFSTSKSGPVGGVAWTVDPGNLEKKEAETDPEKAGEINVDRIVAINDLGQPGTFTELNEHEGAQRSTGAKERRHDRVATALTAMAYDEKELVLFAGSEDGRIFSWNQQGKKIEELGDPLAPSSNE